MARPRHPAGACDTGRRRCGVRGELAVSRAARRCARCDRAIHARTETTAETAVRQRHARFSHRTRSRAVRAARNAAGRDRVAAGRRIRAECARLPGSGGHRAAGVDRHTHRRAGGQPAGARAAEAARLEGPACTPEQRCVRPAVPAAEFSRCRQSRAHLGCRPRPAGTACVPARPCRRRAARARRIGSPHTRDAIRVLLSDEATYATLGQDLLARAFALLPGEFSDDANRYLDAFRDAFLEDSPAPHA
ncbi:hypothetical protein BCEP4_2400008 [Burkholderia cepacia]|nr:hypothetical protein BCEP4_2400008 [Burkholderia cepacia]